MAMNTTLNQIRKFNPCESGWRKLLRHLRKTTADDEVLNLAVVLESNGLDDAIWCMRTLEDLSNCDKFAKLCAYSVAHLNNYYSKRAADYAADYAVTAATATAADYAAYAAYAATYATAAYATAADYAAAGDAATADYAAAYLNGNNIQIEKNKQFFLSLC